MKSIRIFHAARVAAGLWLVCGGARAGAEPARPEIQFVPEMGRIAGLAPGRTG